MSSTSNTSKAKVSSIISSDQEYEVFLSFRGPDTRVGFTDHLYRRLIDANIRVYRDGEEIQKGEEIGPELLQAINGAAIAIPIFSKRYAESEWCLKELVEIMNCRRSRGMKIMPIFYYIKPSEVRNQTGNYEEAFSLHQQKYGISLIRKWKVALSEIGSLSGWEIPSNTFSREGELVDDVTKELSFALKKPHVKIPDHLVRLGHHVENILEMLNLETQGVRIIGIHGMGGIGKTTLAKFVYNHLLPKFQGSSFFADARSKNIEDLETNLRSDILARKSSNYVDKGTLAKRFIDKKVLIVIDDVDEETKIEDLIGKRDRQDWFASGSRIIITTRNEGFLRQVQVNKSYELSEMDQVHSQQLFCRHAFGSNNPKEDYAILSRKIVQTTGGLPLALEVIGCSLRNKCKEEWERKLENLKQVPAKDVSKQLRISYEELDERQKHIFLDIACFFIGKDQRVVIYFWDSNQLYPREALDVLQQKSLIKIHDNQLKMHDQLRDLGREIAFEDNVAEPEKQTRLWNEEEATKVFLAKKGLDKVQGICLYLSEQLKNYFSFKGFHKVPDVKLLWVREGLGFSKRCSRIAISNFLSKKACILSEVRWLSWHNLDCKNTEAISFSLGNLVILDLSWGAMAISWVGWRRIDMAKNLKVLNLTGCRHLVRTPKFSSHLLLERLVLEDCHGLVEIDESIGMLEHLVHLNLKKCYNLRKLPPKLSCMESLTELLIDQTAIDKIPLWHSMVKLEVLSAHFCHRLVNCISLNNLTSLKKLLLAETPITSIPDSISELVNLSKLHLYSCKCLKKLPESIGGLVSLSELNIRNSGIKEIPNSIGYLKDLKRLSVSRTLIKELPPTIGMAIKLEDIDAEHCENLCGLPMLPQSLVSLRFSSDSMHMIPDLSNLINLKKLQVRLSSKNMPLSGVEIPSLWWVGRLCKLEELHLERCNFLKSIPNLPSSLKKLTISTCKSLETLSDLSHLKKLSTLMVDDAPLIKLVSLHDMESLQEITLDRCSISELRFSFCGKLEIKSQMSNCKQLKIFHLSYCPNLTEIHGRLESLKHLRISNCDSLVKLPDVMNVKSLRYFYIIGCPKLCNHFIYYKDPFVEGSSMTEDEIRTLMKICGHTRQ